MNNILVYFGYKDYSHNIDEDNLFDVINEKEEDGYYMFEKYPVLYVSDKNKCLGIPLYYGEDINLSDFKVNINLDKLRDLDREFFCLLSENNILFEEEIEPSINILKIN